MTVNQDSRGSVIIGVDESDNAAEALRWGIREAELHGWSATAVMAWGALDQHHTIVGERFDPAYGEKTAAAALDGIVDRIIGEGDTATGSLKRRVVCELPARALLDAAAGADLLVVGARGMGGLKGLLLGSVSQQCLHHATTAVAVVRDRALPETEGDERILVAVDGSESADRALAWAMDEARVRHAVVTGLHAWHAPYIDGYPYTEALFEPGEMERASRSLLADALSRADTSGLAAPVEVRSVCGDTATAILAAAETADLVVMGSRGLGGFKGLLLGSVTTHVASRAPCAVVVIPSHR